MKYAIVECGGKQYRAVEGSTIDVDRMSLEAGKKVDLSEVLLVADGDQVSVGTPTVKNAVVKASVVEEFRGKKVTIFKYHPRKRYRLKKGHRQWYTKLMIEKIEVKAAKKAAAKKETETAEAAAQE